jgi:metallo-beta-lactamase family protein
MVTTASKNQAGAARAGLHAQVVANVQTLRGHRSAAHFARPLAVANWTERLPTGPSDSFRHSGTHLAWSTRMTATVRFLGATDTVTGSRYLVETGRARLLVDCGLFQGYKKLRERNWAPPPFDPSSVDAVVLTHAHIDHSGYLPRLCNLGFKGPIYCTRGTSDLLKILLPDSGFLQEEDAKRANKYGYTRHRPAKPLYTREDAVRCLSQLAPGAFDESFEPIAGIAATYTRAGHIVGSASVSLRVDEKRLAFSGDVGRPNDPIMKAPALLPAMDYLVVESTYGNRRHPAEDVHDALARVVNEAVQKRGVIVVPSFAVGRAQHLLHVLAQLRAANRIPEVPVYLDSPMSIDATKIFCEHKEDHGISEHECHVMCRSAKYVRTAEESKAIDRQDGPMVIVSASGMATGGRVLHHMRRFMTDSRNTILFVGYQAAGTRGRALIEGADELKLHGEYVKVRARIVQVEGLSAHADYTELIDWLKASNVAPRRVFVTHGEPAASDAFRRRLHDTFGWDAIVPDDGSSFLLE